MNSKEFIRAEQVNASPKLNGVSQQELMKNEIDGVTLQYVTLNRGEYFENQSVDEKITVLLFLAGHGNIGQGDMEMEVSDLSVLIPKPDLPFRISSVDQKLEFMEISLRLNPADKSYLNRHANTYPYFVRYADCKPYKEDIKSEKTGSRMLIPDGIVPRISIGSVQTSGPDIVGAHKHPMLEQLFYGLPGNCCIVHADGHEREFCENTLLHIPLGSMHGVRVEEGRHLHYIWMDFFRNQEDMSYITDSHIVEDD